jgi:hypothetical protein
MKADRRYRDEQLLEMAKAVAKLWIGVDDGKLRGLDVPKGVKNLQV